MPADLLTLFSWVCVFAGLAPLCALWLERRRGYAPMWWLIGAAMAVSTVADLARIFGVPQWTVSALFPVAQFGLIVLAFAPRWTGWALLGVTGMASWAVVTGAGERPDATVTLVGGALMLALHRSPAFLVYFGLGAVAWFWYCQAPGLYPWLAYQSCRLLGLTLLTVAVWRER